MTVTTNSTIEFESKEELNEYLKANGDAFSNVNYLISHINNAWYVTIPRGILDEDTKKVTKNTYFDASYGISFLDQDIWYPGTTKNSSSPQKYISVHASDPIRSWNDNKLSQLKLSYIQKATFSKGDGTTFDVYRDEFKQAWKNNHSSYMITKIEAWGVK